MKEFVIYNTLKDKWVNLKTMEQALKDDINLLEIFDSPQTGVMFFLWDEIYEVFNEDAIEWTLNHLMNGKMFTKDSEHVTVIECVDGVIDHSLCYNIKDLINV